MPVHVVRIPPRVVQPLPEKPCLANTANFVASRDDSFFPVLPHQFTQRVHDVRLGIIQQLVVGAKRGLLLLVISSCSAEAVIPSEATEASGRTGRNLSVSGGHVRSRERPRKISVRRSDCSGHHHFNWFGHELSL